MAAYIVFETGHTFGPSMLYSVYRLVGETWFGAMRPLPSRNWYGVSRFFLKNMCRQMVLWDYYFWSFGLWALMWIGDRLYFKCFFYLWLKMVYYYLFCVCRMFYWLVLYYFDFISRRGVRKIKEQASAVRW